MAFDAGSVIGKLKLDGGGFFSTLGESLRAMNPWASKVDRGLNDPLREATGEFRETGAASRSFGRDLLASQATLEIFGPTISGFLTNPLLGAASAAKQAGSAISDMLGLGISLAADFQETKVAFEVMLGSAGAAMSLLEELDQYAASTPFQLPSLTAAAKSLLAFGFAASEIVPQMRQLGDLSAGLNIPIGELAEIYGKARVQGRLFMEDINQLTGRGIPIIGSLAEQFGVAESAVRDLVSSGEIGFEHLQQAVADLTGEGGKFSGITQRQSELIRGQWSTLQDNASKLLRDFSLVLAESLNLAGGMEMLTAAVQRAAPSVLALASSLGDRLAAAIDLAASYAPQFEAAFSAVMGVAADVGSAVAAGFGMAGDAIGAVVDIAAPLLANLVDLFGGLGDTVTAVGAGIAAAVGSWGIAAAVAAAAAVIGPLGGLFGLLGAAVAATVGVLASPAVVFGAIVTAGVALLNHFDLLRPAWEGVVNLFRTGADFVTGTLVPAIGSRLVAAWSAVEPAVTAAGGVVSTIWDLLKGVAGWIVREAVPVIGGLLAGAFDALRPVLDGVGMVARGLWDLGVGVVGFLARQMAPQLDALATVLRFVGGVAGNLWTHVLKPVFGFLGTGAMTALRALGEAIGWVLDKIGQALSWLGELIGRTEEAAGKAADLPTTPTPTAPGAAPSDSGARQVPGGARTRSSAGVTDPDAAEVGVTAEPDPASFDAAMRNIDDVQANAADGATMRVQAEVDADPIAAAREAFAELRRDFGQQVQLAVDGGASEEEIDRLRQRWEQTVDSFTGRRLSLAVEAGADDESLERLRAVMAKLRREAAFTGREADSQADAVDGVADAYDAMQRKFDARLQLAVESGEAQEEIERLRDGWLDTVKSFAERQLTVALDGGVAGEELAALQSQLGRLVADARAAAQSSAAPSVDEEGPDLLGRFEELKAAYEEELEIKVNAGASRRELEELRKTFLAATQDAARQEIQLGVALGYDAGQVAELRQQADALLADVTRDSNAALNLAVRIAPAAEDREAARTALLDAIRGGRDAAVAAADEAGRAAGDAQAQAFQAASGTGQAPPPNAPPQDASGAAGVDFAALKPVLDMTGAAAAATQQLAGYLDGLLVPSLGNVATAGDDAAASLRGVLDAASSLGDSDPFAGLREQLAAISAEGLAVVDRLNAATGRGGGGGSGGGGGARVEVGDVLVPSIDIQELGALFADVVDDKVRSEIDNRVGELLAAGRAANARGSL